MDRRRTLNITQACEYLGCSRSYTYRLYELGKIEGYRLGTQRGIRFYIDSLDSYISERCGE